MEGVGSLSVRVFSLLVYRPIFFFIIMALDLGFMLYNVYTYEPTFIRSSCRHSRIYQLLWGISLGFREEVVE